MPLAHHELCFGCGLANVFGLQLELERRADGSVAGRFFVKQDHQGEPGFAHRGIVAAALDEAISLAATGEGVAVTTRFEVEHRAPAPVGAFVGVEASAEPPREGTRAARASAYREDDGVLVAEARAVLSDDAAAAGSAGGAR